MKQVYDQTWQMFVRLMHYTNRRPDFQPYMTLCCIDDFIMQHRLRSIADWGCGENNHKIVYDIGHMVGIDRTLEADIYGYPKDVWDQIPQSQAILAVNSMHFSTDVYSYVARAFDEKLEDGGEIFVTINNTGHANAQLWADPERWKEIGQLEYYWNVIDHEEQMKEELREFLFSDHMIINKKTTEELEAMHLNTVQQTMVHDPWHGVVRVRLKK